MSRNIKNIIALLQEYDSKGVPFAVAKEKILQCGYTNAQIAHALYQFNYDGVPNRKPQKPVITQLFEQHPEDAQKIADYILQNSKQNTKLDATLNYAASRFAPGQHAKAYYELKFADSIGYPYFTALGLSALAFPLVLAYNLPNYILFAPLALVSTYWIIKLILNR